MLNNKNGYFLAETIITTCAILTISLGLYTFINNSIVAYETKEKYDHPQDIYKAYDIKVFLYENNKINEIINLVNTNGYANITNNNYGDIYTKLKTDLKTKLIIVSNRNMNELKNYNFSDMASQINPTEVKNIKKYISKIPVNDENISDFYRIIIYYKDGDNDSYSNIRMLKDDM